MKTLIFIFVKQCFEHVFFYEINRIPVRSAESNYESFRRKDDNNIYFEFSAISFSVSYFSNRRPLSDLFYVTIKSFMITFWKDYCRFRCVSSKN